MSTPRESTRVIHPIEDTRNHSSQKNTPEFQNFSNTYEKYRAYGFSAPENPRGFRKSLLRVVAWICFVATIPWTLTFIILGVAVSANLLHVTSIFIINLIITLLAFLAAVSLAALPILGTIKLFKLSRKNPEQPDGGEKFAEKVFNFFGKILDGADYL
jgi:dedA family protein